MNFLRFLSRRAFYLVFQLLGVITIAFFLVRIIPGNPAQTLAGIGARPETVAKIEEKLGLDKPIWIQYVYFWRDLLKGDLGESVFTGFPVSHDLKQRFPATFELIFISMVICVLIGIPLGILSATRKGSFYERGITFYSMLTGGLPDFWLGLILVFIFYYLLGIAPPPMGRMGISAIDLRVITGLNLVDSIIQGNWKAFEVAIRYLTLPVLTLVLVYTGNIIKMTRSSMEEVMESDFMDYARACGLPNKTVISYQLRNALSPVVTVIAFTNGYLLGGSVLVESVFSWGGMGQYAVQSVTQADYWPLQGFVLVAAMYMAINYLILDIVNMVIDPRIAVQ